MIFSQSLVKRKQCTNMKEQVLARVSVEEETGKETTVKTVAIKKSGCPLLLGKELDKRVQDSFPTCNA